MRRLTTNPEPNVVSYTIEEPYGWVTAATPGKRLLIGYLWSVKDYPWVSLWRDVRDQKPAARGLEFGTTGLHQPFPTLVEKGRIWDRRLFEYLDAAETIRKEYVGFLTEIPADFAGVDTIRIENDRLILRERGPGAQREISLVGGDLLPRR